MLYFIRKYRALLFATVLLFSAVVILTGTHENRRDLGFLDRIALDASGLVARGVSGLGRGVEGIWLRYVYLVGVRGENEALRADIDRLKLKQAELDEAGLEAVRLRKILGFRERAGMSFLPATVIGTDASGWFRTITIDRGSSDGIERGMAVINADGVVGRTHDVASRSAKVLLLTDSNSSIDGLIQRTRARGVLAGRVTPTLEMRYVHRNEDVQSGDRVVSSGIGGVFPKGLPIGVVSRVSTNTAGMFRAVEVAPAVDLGKLEEVLVVTAVDGVKVEPPAGPARPEPRQVQRPSPTRPPAYAPSGERRR